MVEIATGGGDTCGVGLIGGTSGNRNLSVPDTLDIFPDLFDMVPDHTGHCSRHI